MKNIFVTFLLSFFTILAFCQNSKGYAIGDDVQAFALKNVDGKTVSLSDYKDAKGFIVVFTCNECPYAKAYQDRILRLNKNYTPLGYPVIAINANDAAVQTADRYEKMQARAKEKGYTFPYLIDPGQLVTKQFGATNTPHTFVLQRNSNAYTLKYAGAIDNDTENNNPQKINYVEDAVNALLSNKEITTTKTKAIGCGVKWRKP